MVKCMPNHGPLNVVYAGYTLLVVVSVGSLVFVTTGPAFTGLSFSGVVGFSSPSTAGVSEDSADASFTAVLVVFVAAAWDTLFLPLAVCVLWFDALV